MKDYAEIATQYARDVVDGRILVGKWVRLAGERHLRDLDRAAAGWRYQWNPLLRSPDERGPDGDVVREGKDYRPADRACTFIELLPHIKGDWAARSERIRLQPWQTFFVAGTFGWIDVDAEELRLAALEQRAIAAGFRRRFRTADLIVPRKNAKSTVAAGIGLYMLAADGEFGAEVYSGATSEKQAGEVFNPAKLMAERSPDYRSRFGVVVRASGITIPENNSKFEPLIGKPGDGASPSCSIHDEYHEQVSSDQYDTMRLGMGARRQPLQLVITTAGDDVSGPCFAHQEELQDILDGLIEDETRFGLIYTIDTDEEGKLEDWTTEEAVIKANPNYNVSVDAEGVLADLRDAIRDPRKQAAFQTKRLNIWVASSSPWLNLHEVRQCVDKTLDINTFKGRQLTQGLDLSNFKDITSNTRVFRRREDDGFFHFYVFWRHYLPRGTIEDPDNKIYQAWLKEGWLIQTEGNMVDYEVIENDLLEDRETFATHECAIDDWGAASLSPKLADGGYEVIRIGMNTKFLSQPMKFIDGLVTSKRIHFQEDPVAIWGLSNVGNKPGKNDSWFPLRPANKKKKIDPALALIVAMNRAMIGAELPQKKYQFFAVG